MTNQMQAVLSSPMDDPYGFIIFNLSQAKDARSADCERLIQELAQGLVARCAERELSLTDLLYVVQESLARFIVAAVPKDKEAIDVVGFVNDTLDITRQRCAELMQSLRPPGAEPIARN